MPLPTASDVHVNAPLTTISIAFMQNQNEFIASRMFPTVTVSKQSDRYYVYNREDWFKSEARERAPATESAGSGFRIDNTPTYFAGVKAVHKDVDDQIRANADPVINLDRDATEFVSRDLMLDKEINWASKYFTTGIWTGSTTGSDVTPGTLWSAGGSSPIEDMRAELLAVKRKTGYRPNKIALGDEVWNVLQDHPDFLERIKYTQRAVVSTDLLAGVLGVDQVLVGGAIRNTANEGAAASLSFIMGKNVLLAYCAPRPSLMWPSAGYTFAWTGMFGANATGTRIKRFRMEHLASDRVEGENAYDQKVIAADCGAFMSAVVA